MNDMDIVEFFSSDQIFSKAASIFKTEQTKLQALLPYADIQHVGSTAIPYAIGKFDVDIQLRVPKENFDETIELLDFIYTQKHPHLWKDGFAIYDDYTGIVDYVVTAIGSQYDDFHLLRDYFIANPWALIEYNSLKSRYDGKLYHEYREAKQQFLGGNGNTRFLRT